MLKMVVVRRLPNWRIFVRLGFLAVTILLFGFGGAIFAPLLVLTIFLCIMLLHSAHEGLLVVREARRRERRIPLKYVLKFAFWCREYTE